MDARSILKWRSMFYVKYGLKNMIAVYMEIHFHLILMYVILTDDEQ